MPSLTGWGRGTWGSSAWSTSLPVELTGVSSTGSINSVTIVAEANLTLTGVSATADTAQVLVWGGIVPNQNPSYNPINPSSTPSWADESPSQSPGWDDIAA